MKRAAASVNRASSGYFDKAGRTSCVDVTASISKKRGVFDHLLPRKAQQIRSSSVINSEREEVRVVNEEQLMTAVKILSQNPTAPADSDEEISILSSLDVEDIMFEADRVHLELRPPVDLDVLRQYAAYLKPDDEEEEEEDEAMM